MPKAQKAAKPSASDSEKVPFEEALQKLEDIVESMEGDDLPLESMLKRYEEGTRLVQACQTRLTEAEAKIKKLEADAEGNLELKEWVTEDETEQ